MLQEMLESKHVNIVLNYGGLGDQIMRAPSIKELLDNYPHISITIFTFASTIPLFFEWFGTHERVLDIKPLEESYNLANGSYLINFLNAREYQLGMHGVDHGHMTLLQKIPTKPIYYLPLGTGRLETPETSRLVVLTPNYTAESRALPAEVWEEVQRRLLDMGLRPVIIGASKSEFKATSQVHALEGTIDLRDRTTLLEAIAWMEKSIAVMGLDNGLIHLAGCTKVPIIVGYTTQIPQYRAPKRVEGKTVCIIPGKGCQGCETWLRYEPHHEFTGCFTKTFECVKTYSADTFIGALKEIYDLG